jgi:D-methionine transport system ATP-binding protein
MIFQHFNLLSSRTVYGNVALPLELAGMPKDKIREKVMPLIELVGLSEHVNKYPSQLSGGQKQRVGIARALSSDPKILLSDEATSALDPETTQATLQLLKKINKELGLTIVMITHEMDVVKQICNRVVVMNKGVVVEEGDVLEVFRDPKNEVTQAMLGTALAARTIPASMVERVKKVLNTPGENGRKNHLIRLTFVGSSTTEPVLSRACSKFDLDFNILLGQVDEIQSESYGTLTIVMEGTTENFRQALNYIAERGIRVEELTNVI